MILQAKLRSRCPHCGEIIEPGDKILWEPGMRAQHVKCPENPDPHADIDDWADAYPIFHEDS
jgi:hypothetical protein